MDRRNVKERLPSYLGVTLHYVQEVKLCKFFLGLRQLSGSHTAAYILSETNFLLSEYEFSLKDVSKVVTDNGANVIRAFDHITKFDDYSYDECDAYENDEETDDEIENIFDMPSFSEIPDESILLESIPQRISCFAHSLQLVIGQAFKEHLASTSAFKVMFKVLNSLKHSQQAKEEIRSNGGKVPLMLSGTRWGSIIRVTSRFLKVKELAFDVALKKKWLFPTAEEINFLDSALKVLSPFGDVLRKIQGETTVTISRCYQFVMALQCLICEFKISMPLEFHPLIGRLQVLLRERFSYMTSADRANFDPTFLVACAIDPNTASCLKNSDLVKVSEWIRQMLPVQRICSGFAGPMDSSSISSQQGLTLDMTIKKISNDEWRQRSEGKTNRKSWILGALYNVQSVGGGDAFVEPMKYWHGLLSTEWNKLAALAIEILSIPATSAPIERIFSQAGFATRGHRNRTEFKLLNHQLVVSCNRKN